MIETYIGRGGILRIYPRPPSSFLPSNSDSHIIHIFARARTLTGWLCELFTPHCALREAQTGQLSSATTLQGTRGLGPIQIAYPRKEAVVLSGGVFDPKCSYHWKRRLHANRKKGCEDT